MCTRIRSVALASLLVLAFAGAIPDASAQADSTVALRLISQTPILTPAKPDLKITVHAKNTGTSDIAGLQVGVVIGASIVTRTDFETSITNGPGTPILARTFPVNGALAAGASRDLSIEVSPTTIPGLLDDSQVYPLRVSVRDASSGAELGGLNSAVIEIVRIPEKPLRLGWTFEVGGGPPALDPQGRATTTTESALALTGGLSQEVAAIGHLADAGVAFDMAVEPSLLEQIGRMTDGYERVGGTSVAADVGASARAATILTQLGGAAAGSAAEVATEPFAWPSIPAMLDGGLSRDLGTQNYLGRTTLTQALGVPPNLSVTRPPTGALNDQALRALITRNVSLVLAQPDSVTRPPQTNDFAPPPAAVVEEGNTSATLVLPDPGTQALIDAPSVADDPVRAAQLTLGGLATVWKQQPVPGGDVVRGVALTLPTDLPAGFWGAFTNRVTKASFLMPVTATDLVAQVPPPPQPVQLADTTPDTFRGSYVNALRAARGRVAAYQSMLPAADPQPDRLDRDLLVSESSAYLSQEQIGRGWISQVRDTTDSAFACAVPPADQVFTFTKLSGTILLTVGPADLSPGRVCDPAARPVKVRIVLQSSRMSFPDGASRTITLERAGQIVTFAVKTKAVGPSPVRISVLAPNGRVIGEQTIIIRSTAINTIALGITIGAGLILVLLWGRRWFKRPTR